MHFAQTAVPGTKQLAQQQICRDPGGAAMDTCHPNGKPEMPGEAAKLPIRRCQKRPMESKLVA